MLRATSFSRYAVKLKNNLPHGQAPVPVLPRSFSSTARLCEALVHDCMRPENAQQSLGPWQRVRHMQIVSIHNVLRRLSCDAGVDQIERFFEKAWNPRGPLGRTMGRGRAGKRGQNLPTNRWLHILEDRLATLYDGRKWPLQVDCYQVLWLSLLVERPILGAAEELLTAHHTDAKFPEILAMGLPILETGSTWKFSLWVGTQHASLAYLAGCIVLLRLCAEKGLSAIAYEIAEVVCQLLAILGPELQDRGIGATLLRYCTEHILPIGGIHTSPGVIAHAAAMLNLIALAPWASEGPVDWPIRKRVMNTILAGNFGVHLQFFCDPIALPMPRHLVAKWARSLRDARLSYTGSPIGAEAYRDRIIDMPDLFERAPEISTWLRSDPRFSTTRRPRRSRGSSWCDGLSAAPARSSAARDGLRSSHPANLPSRSQLDAR